MERPTVCLNLLASIDGKIATTTQEPVRLGTDVARRAIEKLRAEADAVIVGAETVRSIDPHFQLRDPEMIAYRASLGKPPALMTIVVTASANVPPTARVFTESADDGCIVATVEGAARDNLVIIEHIAKVWTLGLASVNLYELLRELRRKGVTRVVCEGGGELHGAFIQANLVDEVHVTLTPTILGGALAPSAVGGAGLSMATRRNFKLVDVTRAGDELLCRYVAARV